MKAKILILSLLALSIGCSRVEPIKSQPLQIGSIEGKRITIEDLNDQLTYKLHVQFYDAAYQKFTLAALEQLGKKHPRFSLPEDFPVSNLEVNEFYRANQNQIKQPLNKVKPNIIAYLQSQKRILKISELFKTAEKEGLVTFAMAEPVSPKIKISANTAFFLAGDPQKRGVMLLEFSDYHCPYCSKIQATFQAIQQEQKDIQFAFRHFPLKFHPNAEKAALAVECSRGEKKKLYAMHQAMFKTAQISTLEGFSKIAAQNGIATPRFEECYRSGQPLKKIQEDIKQASTIGIQGTPSFVIGIYDPQTYMVKGELFSGALPKEQILKVLQGYQSKL